MLIAKSLIVSCIMETIDSLLAQLGSRL